MGPQSMTAEVLTGLTQTYVFTQSQILATYFNTPVAYSTKASGSPNLCTGITNTVTYAFSTDQAGTTAVSTSVVTSSSPNFYWLLDTVQTQVLYIVQKVGTNYAWIQMTFTVQNNDCSNASITPRRYFKNQIVSKNQPYAVTGAWTIVQTKTPNNCAIYGFGLKTSLAGSTDVSGMSITSTYQSQSQLYQFTWDQSTNLGSTVTAYLFMYVDDTNRRFIAGQRVSLVFQNQNDCVSSSISATTQIKEEIIEMNVLPLTLTYSTYGLTSPSNPNCDAYWWVFLNSASNGVSGGSAVFYTSDNAYTGDYSNTDIDTVTIWQRDVFQQLTFYIYAINSGYQKTPLIQLNLVSQCIVTVTYTNQTTPVLARLLSGSLNINLKDYLSVSKTSFKNCVYQNQNLYNDQARTVTLQTQSIFSNNFQPFTVQVDVTTPGTFQYYYEVLLTAESQYVNTPLIFMSATVCGLETINAGTYQGSNSVFLQADVTENYQTEKISQNQIEQVLTLDSSLSSPICKITNYVLCEDALCQKFFASSTIYIQQINTVTGQTGPKNSGSTLAATETEQINSLGFYHFVQSLEQDLDDGVQQQLVYHKNSPYDTSLYLGAVTKGYVFGTIPLRIEVTCANVLLSLSEVVFLEVTYQISSGSFTLLTNQLIESNFNNAGGYIQSSVNFDQCPISLFSLENFDLYAFTQLGAQAPSNNTIVQATQDQLSLDQQGNLILNTAQFNYDGIYYKNLLGSISEEGPSVSVPIQLSITADASISQGLTVNIVETISFVQPIENQIINLDPQGGLWTYNTPPIDVDDLSDVEVNVSITYNEINWKLLNKRIRFTLNQAIPGLVPGSHSASIQLQNASGVSSTYVLNIQIDDGTSEEDDDYQESESPGEIQQNQVANKEESLTSSSSVSSSNVTSTSSNQIASQSAPTVVEETPAVQSITLTVVTATQIQDTIATNLQAISNAPVPVSTNSEVVSTVVSSSVAEWQDEVSSQQFSQAYLQFVDRIKEKLIQREEQKGKTEKQEKLANKVGLKGHKMSRSGVIKIEFHQPVFIPDFNLPLPAGSEIQPISDGRRQLISLQQINVQRDVMSVRLVVKSDVDVNDIKYYLQIQDWTENDMSILMNFTTPMLVSQGVELDEVYMTIINPYLFISQVTGQTLDIQNIQITQPIPRMVPKGVDLQKVQDNAIKASQALQSLIYIQIILQVFLKGAMEDMWGAFFAIQILSYLTLYAIPVPSNAEIYVEQFRALVDFDIFKPDNFLPLINPEWNVVYFVNIGKSTLLGGLQSSGINSGSIVMNLQTYIFMALFSLLVLTLMSTLLIFKKFHDRIKAKIIDILNKTFWNNSIRSLNISYLKTALAFVVAYKLDGNIIAVRVLTVFGIIPVFFVIVLIYNASELDTPKMKMRIERMYQDVHLRRNHLTKFYYPTFLIRRFIYIIIPVMAPFYPIFQLVGLINLNFLFIVLYLHVQPHTEKRKLTMETTNEWMILFCSYHLLCFTGFIFFQMNDGKTDVSRITEVQYSIGFSFVISILLVLIINLIFMVYNISKKFTSTQRKKRIQKAYETRFLDFQMQIKSSVQDKAYSQIVKEYNMLVINKLSQSLNKEKVKIGEMRQQKEAILLTELPLDVIKEMESEESNVLDQVYFNEQYLVNDGSNEQPFNYLNIMARRDIYSGYNLFTQDHTIGIINEEITIQEQQFTGSTVTPVKYGSRFNDNLGLIKLHQTDQEIKKLEKAQQQEQSVTENFDFDTAGKE